MTNYSRQGSSTFGTTSCFKRARKSRSRFNDSDIREPRHPSLNSSATQNVEAAIHEICVVQSTTVEDYQLENHSHDSKGTGANHPGTVETVRGRRRVTRATRNARCGRNLLFRFHLAVRAGTLSPQPDSLPSFHPLPVQHLHGAA